MQGSRVPPAFVVKTVMKVRQSLLGIADRLLPAEIAILEHAHHFTSTHLLRSMAELGIAEQLASGAKSAAEMAPAIGCDADALHRVLRACAVSNFVRLDGQGRFHETRLTRVMRADGRFQSADWCRYVGSVAVQQSWLDLTESVRTGENGFRRVNGATMFGWLDTHPEEGRAFAQGLAGITRSEAPAIVAAYPFPKTGVVCDVAGGSGALLAEVLAARPMLRGVLVEAPPVLSIAREYLDSMGLAGRVQFSAGDLSKCVEAEADVYLLKWILHDWDDDTCVRMLRVVAATMPARSRLVIIEGDQPRNRADPRLSPLDVQMLAVCEGGRERSVAELQALLQPAGLRAARTTRTATGLVLLEAVLDAGTDPRATQLP